MTVHVHRFVLLPYPVSAVYELVRDIEQYPAFLPGIDQVEVCSDTPEEVVANLQVHLFGQHLRLVSRNQYTTNERIDLSFDKSPFATFSGFWFFKPADGSSSKCQVGLDVSYSFSNFLLDSMARLSQDALVNKVLNGFQKRAQEVITT